MADVWRFFANEDDYPELDAEACVGHLSRAIRFATVSDLDPSKVDWNEFDLFQAWMRETYPAVFVAARVESVGHALLLTLPGADETLRPALLMAHQDVVGVVEGTEDDWTHPAFSGHVDDTYVWGRGTVDMKDQLVGELEALEFVLSRGGVLRRTLYLAFGNDEECLQAGAKSLAALLASRGVTLEFLLDEGEYLIEDAAPFGAPGTPFMRVDLAEKGYADIRLVAHGAGGHSSRPYGGTSLGNLSRAIARIVEAPYPVSLPLIDRETIGTLAPHITEGPLAGLASAGRASIDANADAIAAAWMRDPELFPLVTTTIAPTMIKGGSPATNVLPQEMAAVINLRLLEGTSQADVLERCRELVGDLPVEVSALEGGNDPSRTSRADGYGFAMLGEAAARYFRDPASGEAVTPVPFCATGATDARMYEGICDTCLRFSAFVVDGEESRRGVHGTDERITRRAFLQGIRMLIHLVEKTCVLS